MDVRWGAEPAKGNDKAAFLSAVVSPSGAQGRRLESRAITQWRRGFADGGRRGVKPDGTYLPWPAMPSEKLPAITNHRVMGREAGRRQQRGSCPRRCGRWPAGEAAAELRVDIVETAPPARGAREVGAAFGSTLDRDVLRWGWRSKPFLCSGAAWFVGAFKRRPGDSRSGKCEEGRDFRDFGLRDSTPRAWSFSRRSSSILGRARKALLSQSAFRAGPPPAGSSGSNRAPIAAIGTLRFVIGLARPRSHQAQSDFSAFGFQRSKRAAKGGGKP